MLLNFDFDGVIADSSEQLLQIVSKSQALIGVGRPPAHSDYDELNEHTFEAWGKLMGVPRERSEVFVSTVHNLQSETEQLPPLYPGIKRVVKQLSVSHILAVISSSSSAGISKFLAEHSMSTSIAMIAGGETGATKADRLLSVCAKFGFPASEAFMIGDAVSDMRAGRAAGVQTVAVAWGNQSVDLLEKEDPDYLVHSPSELLALFCEDGRSTKSSGVPGSTDQAVD